MSHHGNSTRRFMPEDLRVDGSDRPDWVSGASVTPRVGDHVLCTGGLAEVVQIHGKTGDGSRLLSLKLLDGTPAPFFVAASNILVPPSQPGQMIG